VEAGEEVVVSRVNKPIARLVLYTQPKAPRRLGEAKARVCTHPMGASKTPSIDDIVTISLPF